MILQAHYDTPFGRITIGYDGDTVVFLRLGTTNAHSPAPVTELAAAQLLEYFEGKRKVFTFPIHPQGTAFQQAVWAELSGIPYGETRTYGQIAAAVGRPQAARAVGQAANKNPIWIAIPCHRLIGKNAALTGYAGGLELKQKLLNLEQCNT